MLYVVLDPEVRFICLDKCFFIFCRKVLTSYVFYLNYSLKARVHVRAVRTKIIWKLKNKNKIRLPKWYNMVLNLTVLLTWGYSEITRPFLHLTMTDIWGILLALSGKTRGVTHPVTHPGRVFLTTVPVDLTSSITLS